MIELGDNMSVRIKRKIKIKWKNLFILLVFSFLLIFGITEIVVCIVKVASSPKTETKVKEKPKKEVKYISEDEEKLQKLNHVNKKVDYFNPDYLDRYIMYKEKNSELDDKQIVKNVNMNLDKTHYEDTKKAKNLNTTNILVNKYYSLDENYVPDNLVEISNRYALNGMEMVKEAATAFESMAKDAQKENLKIIAMSTYRSYNYQIKVYNQYVKADGKEKADTYSGRPGYSEHQTGLAVDVYNGKENYTNFEKTDEFDWMKEHADEYGFILRFPKGKEEETGYTYESWHYRYVGPTVAKYIKQHNISFEEYYATKIKDW